MKYTESEGNLASAIYADTASYLRGLILRCRDEGIDTKLSFRLDAKMSTGRKYVLVYDQSYGQLVLNIVEGSGALVEEELTAINDAILKKFVAWINHKEASIADGHIRKAYINEMSSFYTRRYPQRIKSLGRTLSPEEQEQLETFGVDLPEWCHYDRSTKKIKVTIDEGIEPDRAFWDRRCKEFDRCFNAEGLARFEGVTNIAGLVGATIDDVLCDDESFVILLGSGRILEFYHCQDCCETVTLNDVEGDLNDLRGGVCNHAEVISQGDDELLWTFYRFGTEKGSVTLRWVGESNGYYSVEVDQRWGDIGKYPVFKGQFVANLDGEGKAESEGNLTRYQERIRLFEVLKDVLDEELADLSDHERFIAWSTITPDRGAAFSLEEGLITPTRYLYDHTVEEISESFTKMLADWASYDNSLDEYTVNESLSIDPNQRIERLELFKEHLRIDIDGRSIFITGNEGTDIAVLEGDLTSLLREPNLHIGLADFETGDLSMAFVVIHTLNQRVVLVQDCRKVKGKAGMRVSIS